MPVPFLGCLAGRYDVLMIANGTPPPKRLILQLMARCGRLVAVDGGVNTLCRLGLPPSIVIGDLDSADSNALRWAKAAGATVIRRPSPDAPDFAKGLDWCRRHGAKRVLIIGATGERLDHVLCALQTAANIRTIDVALVTGQVCAVILRGVNNLCCSIPQYHTVSWFGLPEAGSCSITGVRWPFRNRRLRWDGFHSLSNEPVVSKITVSQKTGVSVLFVGLYANAGVHEL